MIDWSGLDSSEGKIFIGIAALVVFLGAISIPVDSAKQQQRGEQEQVKDVRFELFLLSKWLRWLVERYPSLLKDSDFRQAASACSQAEKLGKEQNNNLPLSQLLEKSQALIKSSFASLRQVIRRMPKGGNS